jgi:hypothetical protein
MAPIANEALIPSARTYVSQDHYIAQTYLKHWCSPSSGKLYAYRKNPAGAPFFCSPRDVCREWNGDLNPLFEVHPDLLGKYRKLFEPGWNSSIDALRRSKVNANDKFHIAGYWAQLTASTPTWLHHSNALFEHQL